jgi:hypothetical protein
VDIVPSCRLVNNLFLDIKIKVVFDSGLRAGLSGRDEAVEQGSTLVCKCYSCTDAMVRAGCAMLWIKMMSVIFKQ